MDNHLYLHPSRSRSRTERGRGRGLYVAQNPEVKAHPEASPGAHHKDDAIAIIQNPDPDPRLVAGPDLAVAVEVVAVTIAGAKAARLLPTLALREVPR